MRVSKEYLGFCCDQCGTTFVYLEDACMHEGSIADNNGVCPNTEESSELEE